MLALDMRLSTRAGSLLCCAISLGVCDARAAASVDASQCPGLDATEIARLLELEIATMDREGGAAPSFFLALSCHGGAMRMLLSDPATSKRLERSIPAPPTGPGAERVVALAASQLLVASWLELLMAPREPAAAPPLPAATPVPKARRVAAQSLSAPKAESAPQLGLDGGLVLRDLRQPLLLASAGVSATAWLSTHWAARVEAGFEHGRAWRETGSVSVWVSSIGVGGGWRASLSPSADWEGFALVGPAFVQLDGAPESAAYLGRTASAVSTQAWVRTGPSFAVGALRLRASACGGLLAMAPGGGVAEDRAVRLAGSYVGGVFELAWSIGSSH